MECFLHSFWLGVGYALWGGESFAVLVVGGSLLKCCGLENGPALYHVVSMFRTECEIFRGFRKKLGGSFTFLSHYPFHLGGSLACPSCDFLFSSLVSLRRSLVYFLCTRVAPLCAFFI